MTESPDALIFLVLMATVLLRLLLVGVVVWVLIPRRRRCPHCAEPTVPILGPRVLKLLLLERRWCMNCRWTGIARGSRATGTRTPTPTISSAALLLLLSAAACRPEGDRVAELFGNSARWIDLSYSFDEHTIYWPTAQPFKLTMVSERMTPGGYFYSAANFSAAEHGGTHLDAPFRRVQEAREDLQRGGLARAVRSEKADPLARGDGEGDVLHRLHVLVGAMEERAQGRAQAGRAAVDPVPLAQVRDLDHQAEL